MLDGCKAWLRMKAGKAKNLNLTIKVFCMVVGAVGFELTTLCSQSRCANQAALRPDEGGKKTPQGVTFLYGWGG